MHTRYRIALAVVVWLALLVIVPPFVNDVARALEKTDAPENWASIRANLSGFARFLTVSRAEAAGADAPMQFADFVGTWSKHGYMLTIYPDGLGVAVWRTYDGDAPDAPGGRGSIVFDRVDGRTLYGTVMTSTHRVPAARASLALTEYDHGVGLLTAERDVPAPGAPFDPSSGSTLCGPRFHAAPEWFKATAPCGA